MNKAQKPPKVRLKTLKPNTQILAVGRRWFDGNNEYHSMTLYVDLQEVAYVPFTYGYGSQYEYTALKELRKLYKVPDAVTALWHIRDQVKGCKVLTLGFDVKAKKNL